jgi:valyl-tRNA synthetase
MKNLPPEYNHTEAEPRISRLWDEGSYFKPDPNPAKRPFSMFLPPPNASGGMHIGNVFVIALQDILARYHRAKGDATVWIPGTDHGGYETQVTFERELAKKGGDKSAFTKKQLFAEIQKFAENNNSLIKKQIRVMGASVDWSRYRYTIDENSSAVVGSTFRKMVADKLIYRRSYMVNYCFHCGTVLADIELGEKKTNQPLYYVKFAVENSSEHLTVATLRPEYLFSTTHILVHPSDKRHVHFIGKKLINPSTGAPVEVIASKRKYDPEKANDPLQPFAPSYKRYDYEYTLRNTIPSKNLLDWNGKMIERYPGLSPLQAREKEAAFLKEHNAIEKIDEAHIDSSHLCKSGHSIENIIVLTWFLKIDDPAHPLRAPAVNALKTGQMGMYPLWRMKGLVEYMEKMHDWPIARQSAWGIRMPIWYDVSDPTKYMVWFVDRSGQKVYGNLKNILENGTSLEEIEAGLEQIHASADAPWTIDKEPGKQYIQESDTFDTWFSSGQWSTTIYGGPGTPDFKRFYPSHVIINGHDLVRLSASRKVLLGCYLTGKLPSKNIYLHHLIKGKDGQKMSKSLGNAVNPEHYFETYGADVMRLALVSHAHIQDDFIFTDESLETYKKFGQKLWSFAKAMPGIAAHAVEYSNASDLLPSDKKILSDIELLGSSIGSYINKFMFSQAQEKACGFLVEIEKYMDGIRNQTSHHKTSLGVLVYIYKSYLGLLHPFMPFMTEEIRSSLFGSQPLASLPWPTK